MRHRPLVVATALLGTLPLIAATACNALFGVDALTYEGAGGQPTTTTAGTGGEAATGGQTATGGQGGTGGVGEGGAGGSIVLGPPSCQGLAPTCGPSGDEDCCASPTVTGGAFNRSNDPAFPAIVSDFRLDRFEVTVGRFRRFVEAFPESFPALGDGAHPLVAGSGYNPAWDNDLPSTEAELLAGLSCDPNATWTADPAGQEELPMTCVSWALAFAFCAWDGGRLPTEAEWNYAAAAGNEQRLYPWGDDAPTASLAVHGCMGDGLSGCTFADILPVGSRSPQGDGKSWLDGAHADLAGSLWEWVLDAANFGGCCAAPYAIVNCVDCADLSLDADDEEHVRRGGCFASAPLFIQTTTRYNGNPTGPCVSLGGVRCARDL